MATSCPKSSRRWEQLAAAEGSGVIVDIVPITVVSMGYIGVTYMDNQLV